MFRRGQRKLLTFWAVAVGLLVCAGASDWLHHISSDIADQNFTAIMLSPREVFWEQLCSDYVSATLTGIYLLFVKPLFRRDSIHLLLEYRLSWLLSLFGICSSLVLLYIQLTGSRLSGVHVPWINEAAISIGCWVGSKFADGVLYLLDGNTAIW